MQQHYTHVPLLQYSTAILDCCCCVERWTCWKHFIVNKSCFDLLHPHIVVFWKLFDWQMDVQKTRVFTVWGIKMADTHTHTSPSRLLAFSFCLQTRVQIRFCFLSNSLAVLGSSRWEVSSIWNKTCLLFEGTSCCLLYSLSMLSALLHLGLMKMRNRWLLWTELYSSRTQSYTVDRRLWT